MIMHVGVTFSLGKINFLLHCNDGIIHLFWRVTQVVVSGVEMQLVFIGFIKDELKRMFYSCN